MATADRTGALGRSTAIIGLVTIGQSPRVDVVPELEAALSSSATIVEAGALDEFTAESLENLPDLRAGSSLVTRLRDGREVLVGESFVLPLVEARVAALSERADLIVLLCTGSFPAIPCTKPVIYPERVLAGIVGALTPARIGVLTPSTTQIEPQHARWARVVAEVAVEAASPYGPVEWLVDAAARLEACQPDLMVMDCMGYTRAMRRALRTVTTRPVLVASSCVARVAAELIA